MSYLRIKSYEDAFAIQNYLDPKLNDRFNAYIKDVKSQKKELPDEIKKI